jgi:malic enzyme
MVQLRKKHTALDKYIFMHTIQDSDETLFYAMLVCHTRETMPFVYTPTVGLHSSYIHFRIAAGPNYFILYTMPLMQAKPVRSGATYIDTPRAVCT